MSMCYLHEICLKNGLNCVENNMLMHEIKRVNMMFEFYEI